EVTVEIDEVRIDETRRRDDVGQSLLRLPRMAGERESQPAVGPRDAQDLAQPGSRVGPHLHRVDRQGLVEGVVVERKPLDRCRPELDPAARDRFRVPSLACSTISSESSTPATSPDETMPARSWMPTPGPNPISSTRSLG